MALVVCGLYHGLFWGRMSDINIFAFFFGWGEAGPDCSKKSLPMSYLGAKCLSANTLALKGMRVGYLVFLQRCSALLDPKTKPSGLLR